MRIPDALSLLVIGGSTVFVSSPLAAQVRASERAHVGQRIDGTNITVEYGRPQVRGREELFGHVVHEGELWTPGANWSTTFEVDHDVILNGQDVTAGKYSMWMVHEDDEWTLHLFDDPGRFHTQRPGLEEMAVSFAVAPEESEHTEVLTFDFPEVRRDGTTLRFRWGTTAVSVDVTVHPSATGVLTAEQITPYLGDYALTMLGEEERTFEFAVELVDANGKLRGIVDDGEWAFELVPSAEEEGTIIGFLQDGEVMDVEEGPVRFNHDGDAVTGYTVFGIGIEVWMEAVKQ